MEFADSVKSSSNTDKVFLSGDFNSYTQEDPLQVLKEAGYVDLESKYTQKETYMFGGQIGSLDHIFASPAAVDEVTGLDIWNINSVEPLANEYSRYNYNATILYDESPFRSSDHDPVVVGFGKDKPAPVDPTVTVNARAKCYGTRGSVAVYALNTSDGTIDSISLSTPFGHRVFSDVAPGKAVYAEFPTAKKKAKAGQATIRTYAANDGKPASRAYAAPYREVKCK